MLDKDALERLYGTILAKSSQIDDSSYTSLIFQKGIQEICKKLGEEAVEVAIAGLVQDEDRVIKESVDLLYHLLCLLVLKKIDLEKIYEEVDRRLGFSKSNPDESFS